MTRGRVTALWVITVAVFTAAQIANGVSGTTAYYTASVSGSISGSMAVPPPTDTTGPVFTAPADQAIEATEAAGAIATWTTPTAVDAVDGTVPVSCLPLSGSIFPLGATTVTCTATDKAGNTTSHAFTITVVSTGGPVIAPHGDVTAEATGPTGAHVAYTVPVTSDVVDGPGVATCAPASGSQFPLGTTTVLCDAVDAAGNHAVQTGFTVTVRDTTGPAFTAPANQSIAATGPSGAASWTTPTATDLVDGTDAVVCLPASGSTFPVGVTTVTCTSTDAAGNTTSQGFTVTVVATAAPVATPTQAPAANGNGWNNTDVVVTWHWSSTGSPIDTAHCTTSSTSSGEGTLTLTATCANVAGATGSASYIIKVDRTKPVVVITGHPASLGSSGSATFTFSATDTGGSGIASRTCKLDGGSATPCATATSQDYSGLGAGSHTFTVVATDLAGNSSQATYTWCISARGPSITVGHAADGSNGWNRTAPALVAITVTAGGAALASSPVCTNNGHPLPVAGAASPYGATVTGDGTHAISCRVTDVAGASATGTAAVKVDTVSPTVTIPANITAGTPAPDGAVVRYTVTFADATSGLATTTCSPASGSTFPVGITTVTCSATDKAGNSRSRSLSITVTSQAVIRAMQAKQAVLASLQAELARATNEDLRSRLSDAIRHLGDSLATGLWITTGRLADGNHLDPVNGCQVFGAERAAVEVLAGIYRPSKAVAAAITELATIDELLAQTSIDDAIAAHADPAKVSGAQREMADALADLARHHPGLAVDHWRNAWRIATPSPR